MKRESKLTAPSRARFLAGSSAALSSIAIVKAPARAAEYTLRCGTTVSIDAPINVRGRQFMDRIKKETNGRVDFQIFPNNILGGLTAMINQVREGALDFVSADGVSLSGVVPVAAIHSVGWAFKDAAAGFRAFDGDLGKYVMNDIRAKGLYCYPKMMLIGMRQIASAPRPITKPEDLHGFKIRTPPGAISLDLFRTLGAAVLPLDIPQVYTSLQTHVIDGLENPFLSIETGRFQEVTKYLSVTAHQWSGFYLIGNDPNFSKLPPDLKEIVLKNIDIWTMQQRRDTVLFDPVMYDKLQRQGMTANTPDTRPFRAMLGPHYAKWKSEFGATAWSLLEKYTGKLA